MGTGAQQGVELSTSVIISQYWETVSTNRGFSLLLMPTSEALTHLRNLDTMLNGPLNTIEH